MNLPTENSVSVVIPVFNEFENIPHLYVKLCNALEKTGREYELLFVDDGSSDGSPSQLRKLATADHRVRVILFRRNFGQTAAMQAGLSNARHEYVVTIDADLQNEPQDIPKMLSKLDEGYDLVHGWRRHRKDRWLSRRLPSTVANWMISRVTRFPVHDLGCTLKVMRREIAQQLELYGEMHRFIPVIANSRGARCVEMETKHHPRRFGKTKYGIDRTFRVLLDLLTVKYMTDYFASPMQFFGKLGFFSVLIAMFAGIATISMKLLGGIDMTGNPLLLLCCGSLFFSLQFFCMGILGEVAARNYFKNGVQFDYSIKQTINFDSEFQQVPDPLPMGEQLAVRHAA